jgi:signal transduction histidine kinase
MLSLINDLLDLEKSESGMLTLERDAIELSDVLDQCIQSIESLADRQEVILDLTNANFKIFADAHRLSQVVINLVSNAIKFSPKGAVVKVWAQEDKDMAIVNVSDEGRGVPEHLHEVIFERFHQVEVADALEKGGSGLGLAICKVIVELHGGTINVENNKERGSTFSFSVPLFKQKLLTNEPLKEEAKG